VFYFFSIGGSSARSGAWLVPNSSSSSLNVMKTFATLLMLGQIAEEFHEISRSEQRMWGSEVGTSQMFEGVIICYHIMLSLFNII
jgi:hypothetical protein